MNRVIYVVVVLLISYKGYAQSGFFIQPQIGAGLTELSGNVFSKGFANKKGLALAGGIHAGKSIGHWRISTGLELLRTGCTFKDLEGNNPPLMTPVKWNLTFQNLHLLLPLKVGYEIRLGKLSLVPSLGVAVAYNVRSVAIIHNRNARRAEVFDDPIPYKSFSGFGIGDVSIVRKVNNRISLLGGVSYYQMFTDNMKPYPLFFGGNFQPPAMRQYAMTGNLGVVFKL